MNKKFWRSLLACASVAAAAFSSVAFVGCNSDDDKRQSAGHVLNPDGMGGENILDDGGGINVTEPVLTATGVEKDGEHKIILGETTEGYELYGGATLADWSNSGFTFKRVRCGDKGGEEYGVIFPFDTSAVSDVSKIGVMITLIYSRQFTRISVSTDKTNWTDIGYGEENSIKCGYSERITDLLGNTVSDGNLYQCYYELGEYAKAGSPLYVKCGYSNAYPNALASPAGTDVIAYVSFFDSLKVIYEYL